MAASVKTLVSKMESAFLSVFFDAAFQMASLADSKLFVVFESSEGWRQIGGDDSLLADFQAGQLCPRSTDKLIGKAGKDIPSRIPTESGPFSGRSAFHKEPDESENTSQTSNHLLIKEEKHEKERRYNLNLAQNIKIKKIEKSYERDLSCDNVLTDDEEEPFAGENSSPEQQHLEFDLEAEDHQMLNHDVDDNVDESTFALSTDHLRGKKLFGNEGWNDGDDYIEDSKVKATTHSPKQNRPHVNERRNTEKFSVVKDRYHGLTLSHKEKKRCQLCPISCGRTYTRDAYRKHKAAIHDRKIVCLKCQRGFASAARLKRHLARRRPCLDDPVVSEYYQSTIKPGKDNSDKDNGKDNSDNDSDNGKDNL